MRRADVDPVTRERILTVAAAHMARRGYRGTNLTDVAVELGVTRQALYHHFRNKEAILWSIFESLFGRLAASAEGVEKLPPSDRFRQMIASYVDIILADTAIARVAVTEHHELVDADRVVMQKARRMHLDALENAYTMGVAAGALRDLPPSVAVRIAIGTANWAARWFKADGPESRQDVRAHIETILFSGVGSDRPNGEPAAP